MNETSRDQIAGNHLAVNTKAYTRSTIIHLFHLKGLSFNVYFRHMYY